MNNYKFLLFDLDNTLLDFNESERQAICQVLDKYNIPKEFAITFSKINDKLWKILEKGEISREQLKIKRFELLLAQVNRTEIDHKAISDEYFELISNVSIPYDFSYEILQKCRVLDYKIVIVTNGSTYPQEKRINSSGLKNLFDYVFISEKIGASKPSKSFYEYVLSVINAKANQCLIIGDSLTSDILGGVNSGIDTCWYNPNKIKNTNMIIPTYTVNDLNQIFSILGE